jgi:peptide/nickel transport system permease protein
MSAVAAPLRRQVAFRARISPAAIGTGLFLAILVLAGIAGPAISPHDPDAVSLGNRLVEPIGFGGSLTRPLGTDQLGRDVLSRVIAGARVSLLVAVSATVLAGTLGTLIGLLGGYFGGMLDRVTTWLGDVQMAIPFVVVAIGVAASIKPSALTVTIVLGITGWATYARVARLAARPIRQAAFVDAARVAGASQARIAFRHVLPVILPPVLAIAGQQTGAMMLYEAALSFLGLGVPAGTITWGGMIADARETAQTAWWATVVPGVAIVLVVIGFNATGALIARRLRES